MLHRWLFVPLLAAGGFAWGQLSPGDLSKAHAHLEGVANCTKCHVLGEKVSNDKCLSCHKEIKRLTDKRRGYHASKEVKGKECASCHSDHHGRNFQLIRFEEKTFDHRLAGYELTGAHKRIDCRECHKSDLVKDPELRKDRDTWLGMEKECLSCHEDFHQKTLPDDCAKCHDTEKFRPAPRFDHQRTVYPLVGKHLQVDCAACHKTEQRNGREFQRFKGVAFANCSSCHDDPHRNALMKDCKDCHTEQTFGNVRHAVGRYDHQATGFPLKGKHRKLDCAACHDTGLPPATVLKDRKGIAASDCVQCHKDHHEGRYGTACANCHNEESFQVTAVIKDFDHDRTDFPLLGKHRAVDCRKCHEESYTKPLAHNTCASCHDDYHQGEFRKDGETPDCALCHTVDGFQGSLFTFDDHAKTKFPLDGAHVATPCLECHWKEDRWTFRNIGQRCADCHEDVHQGQIPEKYYPGQRCENCHLTDRWTSSRFDHGQTRFPLDGAHKKQDCRACHKPETGFPYGRFVSLAMECASCHEDSHDGQFAANGATDCRRCHGTEGWPIPRFDHDKTAFRLEGRHAEIACADCHKEVERNGKKTVLYKIERFECADCHK